MNLHSTGTSPVGMPDGAKLAKWDGHQSAADARDVCIRYAFNVQPDDEEVTILLVGEKRGDSLFVLGQEFTEHHESGPSE
jgi:hypothetical protein